MPVFARWKGAARCVLSFWKARSRAERVSSSNGTQLSGLPGVFRLHAHTAAITPQRGGREGADGRCSLSAPRRARQKSKVVGAHLLHVVKLVPKKGPSRVSETSCSGPRLRAPGLRAPSPLELDTTSHITSQEPSASGLSLTSKYTHTKTSQDAPTPPPPRRHHGGVRPSFLSRPAACRP